MREGTGSAASGRSSGPGRSSAAGSTRLPVLLLLLAPAFPLVLAGCGGGDEPARRDLLTMDTVVTITAWGPSGAAAADAGAREVERLAALLDHHKPGSPAALLNAAAGSAPVTAPIELIDVLEAAGAQVRSTSGVFDPTVSPLIEAYGLGSGHPRVPSDDERRRLLALRGWEDVTWDGVRGRASLGRAGQALDLGGLAKGYVVDRALAAVMRTGARAGLVNAGGDLAVGGAKPDGSPFRVGIQDPDRPDGLAGVIEIRGGAVATSGDYERFAIIDGVRWHHLVDPRTGLPGRLTRSATVTASSAMEADALATAVFVLGPDAGMGLVESIQGVEASIIATDGSVHDSPGFGAFRSPGAAP